ncbi:MAG TPA: hypothetical protein VJN96_20805 [Vicinamibacterales bacterium]|nr:hypothetical protein [Vicinamibacterales bacterium]
MSAQMVSPQPTPATQIAAAEAAGAKHSRANDRAVANDPPRTCIIVKPEQIVFPTTTGDPRDHNLLSGDFFASSISFGWDKTYQQGKMPLEPLHPEATGDGLRLSLVRLDPPGLSHNQRFELNRGSGYRPFFPSWPYFDTPGKWMILATAGSNWGCFVIDRPVTSSKERRGDSMSNFRFEPTAGVKDARE